MKISLHWLKDYVAISLPPEKLAHKLTMAGLEVEKMESLHGDTVFELEITPNRPDCLNMVGIARELSAILNKPLKTIKIPKAAQIKQKADIVIEDKNACGRYIGTVVRDVRIKASPEWIQKRLSALDLRPVNNVVDITNFCLMETGQPLHAFDYDKLIGGKIIVRRAKEGESIVTIDGIERKLNPSILVIADARRPVAIAGIMGGKDTEVTETTKNILLESAHFDPVLIRLAGRSLGLSSDSSYRFERGVDPASIGDSASRALSLIKELAGGALSGRSDVAYTKKQKSNAVIKVSFIQIANLLGADISAAQCRNILQKLGCRVAVGKKELTIVPPSFRNDLRREVDVIEEIGRIIGYDNLPSSLPTVKITSMGEDLKKNAREDIRKSLQAQGLNETVTYTMINRKSLERAQLDHLSFVKVKNPLTQDQELMRPSLLPSLLSVVLFNLNRGQRDLRFFETGKVYPAEGERETLGIIMTGRRYNDWREPARSVDYYDLKGVIQQVLEVMGIVDEKVSFKGTEEACFVRGQGIALMLAGKKIGILGRIAKKVLHNYDIKHADVFFAQMDLMILNQQKKPVKRYEPVSEFPAVTRDISLAVGRDVTAQRIFEVIRQSGSRAEDIFLSSTKFKEEYVGDKLPPGQRGMTFSLTYRCRLPRTPRDEEISRLHEKICSALTDQLSAVRR